MNEEIKCAECALKAKYDRKPRSFAGRFWRWHINFCPGWKKYMASLGEEEKRAVAEAYGLKKY